jgi:hypothetical protein
LPAKTTPSKTAEIMATTPSADFHIRCVSVVRDRGAAGFIDRSFQDKGEYSSP